MVVDDSVVVRGVISRWIDAEPGMEVCASAANGAMALVELRRSRPDVVVLDIEMPVMDGLTALPQILGLAPGVKVLIASTLTRRNAEISLRALQLGACDYINKPDGGGLMSADGFARDLLARIHALGGVTGPAAPVAASVAPPRPAFSPPLRLPGRPEVIAVGGSTGAPPLLIKLFERLAGGTPLPILVTQHMPPTFTTILAEQIARACGRPCAEARDGEPVQPGVIYVAPGDWHMTVARDQARPVIRLNQNPQENFCRPAVDPMLRSLAEVYGPGVLAVILTGMGADGAKGCEAVAQAGGRFVVQDEATSVVWGMPGAAAKTGLAERILPFEDIAPYLNQVAGARS
jgi:two-component system chemotaxis response regulator CheB